MIKQYSRKELEQKFKNIKLLVTDFDGTLTTGISYINPHGEVSRSYSTNDHMGLNMVMNLGVEVALMTTGWEQAIEKWAATLDLKHVIMRCLNKGKAVEELTNKLGINLEDVVYIGDDVNDISAMVKVGFPVTVVNCHSAVREFCVYGSDKHGGEGGVRDICDIIIKAKTGKNFAAPYVPEELLKKLN